jgi:protein-arginine kinase activator protein McsA
MDYMRIWQEVDIKEIQESIIIVDDMLGFCPKCKQIGINLKELSACPSCNTEFKFVTSKEAKSGKNDIVMRIRKKLPDLTFVDYDDYERLTGKKKAESLFNV